MESDLYTYLDSIHTASVYNVQIPQNIVYPVVRFERISLVKTSTNMSGGGNCTQYRYQLDHYAATLSAAQALADISRVLHARRGDVGTKTAVSFLDNESQEFLAEVDVYVVSADYMITTIE